VHEKPVYGDLRPPRQWYKKGKETLQMTTRRTVALFVALSGLIQLAGIGFSQSTTGRKAAPITTRASVSVQDADGKEISLKPDEKIAFMFIQAIASMEDDCHRHINRYCPLDELVRGPQSPDWSIGKLKFDPAQDSNYTYTVTITGNKWEARANPGKKGLGGWLSQGAGFMPHTYYNPTGPVTSTDKSLSGSSIDGDSFRAR
jgi:hypothetical protein